MRTLTRGSIHDWVPRIAAELDADLPAAAGDWAAVTEIWARRHVLVHNGGLADQKYAERVPGAASSVLLDVDGEYLRTSIDRLSGLVLGTIFQTWARQPSRERFILQLAGLHALAAEAGLQQALAENLHHFAAHFDDDREAAAEALGTALDTACELGLPGTRRLTQARQPAPGPPGHEIEAVHLGREVLAAGLQEPGERVQLRLVALDRRARSACRTQRGDHPS
jgi:hypothetical protein